MHFCVPQNIPYNFCMISFSIYREGKVVKALIRQFQPYLKLVDANAVKVGTCLTGAVPPVPTHGSHPNDRAEGGDTIFHGIIPSADYLLTFIIPAVIITCMLILAILLACMLHKKRKAGKFDLVKLTLLIF